MTYSVDFRKKVLEIKEISNWSNRETAKHFRISAPIISQWIKNIEPVKITHRPNRKIDEEALKKDIELYPDAFYYERAQRLNVSKSGIEHAMKKLKISNKKKPKPSKS
jgi:transposase